MSRNKHKSPQRHRRSRNWGQYAGAWAKAHPEFCTPVKPIKVLPDSFCTLKVRNEYFTASCLWKCSMGTWICIHAEPPVTWMEGMDKARAKLEIARMGLDYTWIFPKAGTERKPSTASGVV